MSQAKIEKSGGGEFGKLSYLSGKTESAAKRRFSLSQLSRRVFRAKQNALRSQKARVRGKQLCLSKREESAEAGQVAKNLVVAHFGG